MKHNVQQQIIFDLDDTLIYCNKYFDLILGQFADIVSEWFNEYQLPMKEIRDKQIEIDVVGVQQVGFASRHFPESLIDTYRYFCQQFGESYDELKEMQLMKLGLSVYEQSIEPYPGMVETLDYLQTQRHELYLYTGGETVIQQRKIEQMKLADYFQDRIFIRQHKNIEALEEILTSRPFNRPNTWMIGNSLRTDISPALSAGIHAIHINHPDEWTYNIVEIPPRNDSYLYTVVSIEEVPAIITNSGQTRSSKKLSHRSR
jgi:putative hydrolase of the HAD superfamily